MKQCVLHADKVCNDCGECDDRCELDPQKICDNCFRCLDAMTEGYAKIPISGVYLDDEFSPERNGAAEDRFEESYVLDSDEDWKADENWRVRTLPESYFGERVRRTHRRH
ncbi:MAG: hypothetical protein VB062_07695 [Christensenella sp.]|nr:hypothetical protein [Christensenella sp.]